MVDLAEEVPAKGAVLLPTGFLWKRVLALATCAIAVDGFANQILALSIPALMKAWRASRGDFALPTAAGLVGMSLGAVVAGVIGDKLGRKRCLAVSIFVFAVATALTAMAGGFASLTVLRAIAGVGLGGAIPNATSLVAEFTPGPRRVLAVTTANLGIPIGGLIAGLLGALMLSVYGWPLLFVVGGAVPAAAGLALLAFMPASASYRVPPTHQAAQAGEPLSWSALLSRSRARDTVMLSLAFFSTFLAIYAVINWLPAFLGAQGYPLSLTSSGLAAFNLGGILGSLLVSALIGRLGSRLPMSAMAAAAVLCAAGLAAFRQALPGGAASLIAMLAVLGAMISGVQATLFALGAHVFPPGLRASGLGLALGVGRVGAVVSAFVGAGAMGLPPATAFFGAVASAMAASFVCLMLIERHVPRSA